MGRLATIILLVFFIAGAVFAIAATILIVVDVVQLVLLVLLLDKLVEVVLALDQASGELLDRVVLLEILA